MAIWSDGIVDELVWRNQERRVLIVCPEPNEEAMRDVRDGRRDSRDLLRRPENIHKRFYVHLRQAIRAFHNLPSRSDLGEERDHCDLVRRIAFINLKKTGGGRSAKSNEVVRATKDSRLELIKQILSIEPSHIAVAGQPAIEAFRLHLRPGISSSVRSCGILHPSYPYLSTDKYYARAQAQMVAAFPP